MSTINKTSNVIRTIGSTAHGITGREVNDFYMTDPIAAVCLLEKMQEFGRPLPKNIWECACGNGKLGKVFEASGRNVIATDLIERGYGKSGVDFLTLPVPETLLTNTAIVTNPPFKHAEAFVRKALAHVANGETVAMFLRTLFLESASRLKLFQEHPPRYVMVSSRRINCWQPGQEDSTSAMSFSWFVWEKGYKGSTELVWFDKEIYKGSLLINQEGV